jgi:GDP-mannose 6-dehydrogenase
VTTDAQRAVLDSEISLVCVGTPSAANGSQDQGAILRLAEQRWGSAIAGKSDAAHWCLPLDAGAGYGRGRAAADHRSESGKKDGEGFHLCFQPEFLREGSSIRDYDKPPFTVVGANHSFPAERLRELFGNLPCKFIEPRSVRPR